MLTGPAQVHSRPGVTVAAAGEEPGFTEAGAGMAGEGGGSGGNGTSATGVEVAALAASE